MARSAKDLEPLDRTVVQVLNEMAEHAGMSRRDLVAATGLGLNRLGIIMMLDLKRGRTEPLFLSPHGARVRPDNWRSRVFDPAAEAIGRPEITPHSLRHTAASLAIASGADVKAVQRMLGSPLARGERKKEAHHR